MASNDHTTLDAWLAKRLAVLDPAEDWRPNLSDGLRRLRERTEKRRRLKSWVWTLALAGVPVLAFSLFAFPAPRVLAHRCIDCSVSILQSLSSAPPITPELLPELQRKPAPDFTLENVSNQPVKLSDFKGKVVLLNFWATWCHGCQTEIPWFVELHTQYRDKGFAVIGISLDGDGWKAVKPYISQKNVSYPVLLDDEKVSALYEVTDLPVTLILDDEGRIAARHTGLVSLQTYKAEVQELLDSKAEADRNSNE